MNIFGEDIITLTLSNSLQKNKHETSIVSGSISKLD